MLRNVPVDTGATYTVLSEKILMEIGAYELKVDVNVESGDGKKIKAKSFAGMIEYKKTNIPSIFITFKGAENVLGVEFLESLGAELDVKNKKLKFKRKKGQALFYKKNIVGAVSKPRIKIIKGRES